jgi:hypothetical protein
MISASALYLSVQFLLPTTTRAEYFKYKDSSGALVITNKFADIPKKYRKNVKVVWDEELTAKDPHARRMAAAEAQREQQLRQQEKQAQQEEKKGGSGKLRPSDGKTLVIRFDEETGQTIRTLE